jgi:membrane protease YdiL (CAAX protease family)
VNDELVRWRFAHVLAGLVTALVASTVFAGMIYAIGDYELGLQHGRGSDLGRVAGRAALGVEFRTDEPPISVVALLQLPLWLGMIGVPWFVAGCSWRRLFASTGMRARPIDVPVGLSIGAATQLWLVPLLYVPIFWVVGELDVAGPARTLASKAHGWGVLLLILIVGVGAPLVEELFFRGVVLSALREKFAAWPSIIVSALIFGFFHFQLEQFPALVMFGVLNAWLTVRFDRLGPAIFSHIAFNMVTVVTLLSGW